MPRFPVDAPKLRVIKTLEILGFRLIREKQHVSMEQINPDGTKTPLTMSNHLKIKSSTLRAICTQSGISRDEFLNAYEKNLEGLFNTNGFRRGILMTICLETIPSFCPPW